VALKVYEKSKMNTVSRKKSLRREINIMSRIKHPNIVKLIEAIEIETQVILVLEYVDGGSSFDLLQSFSENRLPEHLA
jgi:serine/threonine protein kinase